MKKKIYKWCLQVDFESGDGPALFPLNEKQRAENQRNMLNFWEYLSGTTPPPKVEIVGLTKAQWRKACRIGKELA